MVPNLGVGRVDFDLGRVGAVWLQFYIFFFFVVVVLFCVGYDAHILGFTCKLMLVLETVLNCMEVLIHS